jgi:hypothetical protein
MGMGLRTPRIKARLERREAPTKAGIGAQAAMPNNIPSETSTPTMAGTGIRCPAV